MVDKAASIELSAAFAPATVEISALATLTPHKAAVVVPDPKQALAGLIPPNTNSPHALVTEKLP